MKKKIVLLLAAVMTISLTACGNSSTETKKDKTAAALHFLYLQS